MNWSHLHERGRQLRSLSDSIYPPTCLAVSGTLRRLAMLFTSFMAELVVQRQSWSGLPGSFHFSSFDAQIWSLLENWQFPGSLHSTHSAPWQLPTAQQQKEIHHVGSLLPLVVRGTSSVWKIYTWAKMQDDVLFVFLWLKSKWTNRNLSLCSKSLRWVSSLNFLMNNLVIRTYYLFHEETHAFPYPQPKQETEQEKSGKTSCVDKFMLL